jgi:hypothetical protein
MEHSVFKTLRLSLLFLFLQTAQGNQHQWHCCIIGCRSSRCRRLHACLFKKRFASLQQIKMASVNDEHSSCLLWSVTVSRDIRIDSAGVFWVFARSAPFAQPKVMRANFFERKGSHLLTDNCSEQTECVLEPSLLCCSAAVLPTHAIRHCPGLIPKGKIIWGRCFQQSLFS